MIQSPKINFFLKLKSEKLTQISTKGLLIFDSLKIDDSGNYECQVAENSVQKIKLTVQPSFDKAIQFKNELHKKKIKARLGETLHQICTIQATGNDVKISWLNKDQQVI